jgi:thiosulfate dehydrogenase [quinone] large subunit
MTTLIQKPMDVERPEAETFTGTTIIDEAEELLGKRRNATGYVWGALRLAMGWTFFWAFLDKVFGLGYATAAEDAWLQGGSPTFGFLNFAAKGPFAEFYQGMAGNVVVDWLFMIGLLAIGLPLLLGIGVRLAAGIGVVMVTLMYTAGFILPEHNPFLDEHIINAVIMVGLIVTGGGYLGVGNIWAKTRIVRRFPILK